MYFVKSQLKYRQLQENKTQIFKLSKIYSNFFKIKPPCCTFHFTRSLKKLSWLKKLTNYNWWLALRWKQSDWLIQLCKWCIFLDLMFLILKICKKKFVFLKGESIFLYRSHQIIKIQTKQFYKMYLRFFKWIPHRALFIFLKALNNSK